MAGLAELQKRARTAAAEPQSRPAPRSTDRPAPRASRLSEVHLMRQAVTDVAETVKLLNDIEAFIERAVAVEVARSADVEHVTEVVKANLRAGKLTREIVDEITAKVLERILKDDRFIEKAAARAYTKMLEGTVQ